MPRVVSVAVVLRPSRNGAAVSVYALLGFVASQLQRVLARVVHRQARGSSDHDAVRARALFVNQPTERRNVFQKNKNKTKDRK